MARIKPDGFIHLFFSGGGIQARGPTKTQVSNLQIINLSRYGNDLKKYQCSPRHGRRPPRE